MRVSSDVKEQFENYIRWPSRPAACSLQLVILDSQTLVVELKQRQNYGSAIIL